MNFSWALKVSPQKGVGWGFTGRTLPAGEMARFREKENIAKQQQEEKLPEEQAQEGKAVGRSQPATEVSRGSTEDRVPGASRGGGRKEACAWLVCKRTEKLRPQNGTPQTRDHPAGGSLPSTRRTQAPGTATARVAVESEPWHDLGSREVRWAEAVCIICRWGVCP